MQPTQQFGHTECAPVRVLDPIEFDFSGGRTRLVRLGKTDTPVQPLPELAGEMRPLQSFKLTLWVRPDVTAATVATDLFQTWQALDGFDRSLNGLGLTPGFVRSERTADGEVIQLVLSTESRPGTTERLTLMRDAVNASTQPRRLPIGPSFVRWLAETRAAA
jgi:hypothetical protein